MVEHERRHQEKTFTHTPAGAIAKAQAEHPMASAFTGNIEDILRRPILAKVEALKPENLSPTDVFNSLIRDPEVSIAQVTWLIISDNESIRGADDVLVRYGLWEKAGRKVLLLEEFMAKSYLRIDEFAAGGAFEHAFAKVGGHMLHDQSLLVRFQEVLLEGSHPYQSIWTRSQKK